MSATAIAPRTAPATQPRAWTTRALAALAGLLAAALALATGDFVAGLFRNVQSPRDAVGAEFIDHTPIWLKNFAVEQFGTNDKVALRLGMLIVIGLLGLVLGALSYRRRWIGVVGIAAFGVVGAFIVAVQRPTGRPLDALPPMVGRIAGIVALLVLLDRLTATPSPSDGSARPANIGSWTDRLRENLGTRERKAAIDRRGFFMVSGTRRGRRRRRRRCRQLAEAALQRLREPRQRRVAGAGVGRGRGAQRRAVAGRGRLEVRDSQLGLLPDRHRARACRKYPPNHGA